MDDKSPDFEVLRKRWKQVLLGRSVDSSYPPTLKAVISLSARAQSLIEQVEIDSHQIWPDFSPIELSGNFRQCFSRLRTITMAYLTNGTSQYRSEETAKLILTALDLLSSQAYNSSTTINKNENWWNYKIGAPRPLIDIGLLLYDELGPERRREYAVTVSNMIGNLDNASLKGSNRAIMCQSIVGASILIQDVAMLDTGRAALFDLNGQGVKSVLGRVSADDGFYDDGSYISHHVYPYVGGYGVSHLLSVSHTAAVLHNTTSALSSSDLSVIYQSIHETFRPFVFRGMMMGNVRGRAVSRKDDDDVTAGQKLSLAILRLIEVAPESEKNNFKSLLLFWDASRHLLEMDDESISYISGMQRIKENPGNVSFNHNTGFRIFPMSDRIVYHHQNWSASLALSSVRTGLYETLNSENLKPFYQADGALQLYLDDDQDQYLNDYYPTMDPYHTPGVTAGQNKQRLAAYGTTALKHWAGGVQWETLGAVSFDYSSYDRLSSAKKSWFFLGNAIIAMGIGCKGLNATEVHTTIEARKSHANSTRILFDGEPVLSIPGRMTNIQPAWAYVEGTAGYHFLDTHNITGERAIRSGRWTDINHYPDYAHFDQMIDREYTTIFQNHGINPVNGSYAYAILPNITSSEMATIAEHPDYRVVSNTYDVQAITFAGGQRTMATFWKPGTLGNVQVVTACQMIWGVSGDRVPTYTIAIADPSQQARELDFILRVPDLGSVVSKDEEIKLFRSGPTEKLIKVDASHNHGKTYTIVFERSKPRSGSALQTAVVVFPLVLFTILVLILIPRNRR